MAILSRVLNHNSGKKSGGIPLTPTTSANSLKSQPFTISITLESPPIMLYGQPHESSGSIISGNLILDIKENDHTFNNVSLSLIQVMKYSKPFVVSQCKECSLKKTTLARWDVLTSTATFPNGTHTYPFSHFLPGSLPPTSKLGSINSTSYVLYKLIATASGAADASTTLPIFIARSILRGPDKNSLRVFPPTEVSAAAVLPNVVYPKSTFPIELRLNNVVNVSGDRRWRMRKLSWKIDEFVKIRSNTCNNQNHKIKLDELISAEKKTSKRQPPKSSNLHYSTIITNTTLSRNPRIEIDENIDAVNTDDSIIRPSDSYNQEFHPAELPERQSTSTPTVPPPVDLVEEHLYFEEIRTVAHGEIKSGWKSDFSGSGSIIVVAEINAGEFSTGFHTQFQKSSSDVDDKTETIIQSLRNNANVSCDIDDPTLGVFVTHSLVVSVVVAEELVHSIEAKKSSKDNSLKPTVSTDSKLKPVVSNTTLTGVPTGAARVLRMQFKIMLTERSGLGIAWDDEVPPTYNDVKTLSPPNYSQSSNTSTPILSADSAQSNIIYGIGNTPLIGRFLNQNTPNIDSLVISEDTIQEFTL